MKLSLGEPVSRVVVLGLPGTGKSTILRRLLEPCWRATWWDSEGEYMAEGRTLLSAAQLAAYPALLSDPHARLVVQPQSSTQEGQAEELVLFCRSLLRHATRTSEPMAVGVDELGNFRESRKAQSAVADLFRLGRKRHLAVVLASQVATDIPLTARRLATDALVLRQAHETELDELERIYGPVMRQRAADWKPFQPPAHWREATGRVEP